MAAKINVNRYRLITLLYIVFVCLSVLNVPTSLYQGNLYVIKTFDHQEGILKDLISENSRILDGMDGPQRQNGKTIIVYYSLWQRIQDVG